jgi:hypothetical protein
MSFCRTIVLFYSPKPEEFDWIKSIITNLQLCINDRYGKMMDREPIWSNICLLIKKWWEYYTFNYYIYNLLLEDQSIEIKMLNSKGFIISSLFARVLVFIILLNKSYFDRLRLSFTTLVLIIGREIVRVFPITKVVEDKSTLHTGREFVVHFKENNIQVKRISRVLCSPICSVYPLMFG